MSAEVERGEDEVVEPLLAALQRPAPPPQGASLGWRLLWAVLVLVALLVLVLKQAF